MVLFAEQVIAAPATTSAQTGKVVLDEAAVKNVSTNSSNDLAGLAKPIRFAS